MVNIPKSGGGAVSYADVIEATLARVLRKSTQDLVEPRLGDLQKAIRILDRLVETIAGFAIGTIAGEVFGGVRTWFGEETLLELRRQLGSAWPASCAQSGALETPYLEDAAERPFVDELARKLHVRFCRMSEDVQALLAAVDSLCESRRHRVGVMFDLLAKEENVEKRVQAELMFGWSMCIAAVTGHPLPTRQERTARSQALWLAWEHQLCGTPVLTRAEPEQAGYIMLVS